MTGAYPILPKLGFEIVQGRDVAVLHRLALESAEAAGQRYLYANGSWWYVDGTKTVKAARPQLKIPTLQMPNGVAKNCEDFSESSRQNVHREHK